MALKLIAAIGLSFLGLVSFVIQQTGLLLIDVQNKQTETRLLLPMPMLLVSIAAAHMPDSHLRNIEEKMGSRQVLLRTVCEELSEYPDATFLEIESPLQKVSVLKRGDHLVIDANNPAETVRVRIPIAATKRVFAKLMEGRSH